MQYNSNDLKVSQDCLATTMDGVSVLFLYLQHNQHSQSSLANKPEPEATSELIAHIHLY